MKLTISSLMLIISLGVSAQAGERLLGVAMIPRQVPYSPFSIEKAMDMAYENHCRAVQMGWTWSSMEPQPGQYKLDDLVNGLTVMKQHGFKVMLNIQVINTNVKETPADLLGTSFSAAVMTSRFQSFINQLVPYLDSNVVSISVGNEVDAYLSGHTNEWSTYKQFYETARLHLHAVAPGLPVGVCCTYDGTVANLQNVTTLNQASDMWIMTYYPFAANFQVRSPTSPLVDFPAMINMAGGRPVQLQEVGYPSGRANGSSLKKQAEFVRNVFAAWNNAGNAMPQISYFGLHDFTYRQVRGFLSYYGAPGTARTFRSFLSTLGLRDATGLPKPAWKEFATGAATVN